MNDTEMLGFAILGTAVILHIIIVNITIGTGWISAVARFLGWKKNDANLEIMGRKVFKILIVHELFSGVWGTIITVVLAGFFPTLTAIATDVIFYPILISLSSIIIRIPTIALFWYTWGKVRPGIHSAIGFVMALSGFAIPLGFRYIFSEITYPYAVGMALEGTSRDVVHTAVFSNPVYPPLLLHTWTGALSIGGFIVASFFAIKGNINARSAWTGLWHGALFLGLQAVMGPWYLLTLSSYAPLLFDNVLGVTGASFNVLPLFTLKMAVITGLVVLTAATWRRVKKGAGLVPRYALLLGPLAMAAATIGEFINDGGRYPYMVLLGQGGLLPSDFMNVYTGMPIDLVYGIVIALFLFVGLFMATVYYALNKRFLVDVPSEPMNDA